MRLTHVWQKSRILVTKNDNGKAYDNGKAFDYRTQKMLTLKSACSLGLKTFVAID